MLDGQAVLHRCSTGTSSSEDARAARAGGHCKHMRPCNHPLCGQDLGVPADTGHSHVPQHSGPCCPPACLERLGPGEQPCCMSRKLSSDFLTWDQSLNVSGLLPYAADILCVGNSITGRTQSFIRKASACTLLLQKALKRGKALQSLKIYSHRRPQLNRSVAAGQLLPDSHGAGSPRFSALCQDCGGCTGDSDR